MPYDEWTRYRRQFSPECTLEPPPHGLYCPRENAVAVDGWESVGNQCLADWSERGFIVVNNAISPSEVVDAAEATIALLGGSAKSYNPGPWGHKHGVLLRPGYALECLSGEDLLERLVLARGLVEHDLRLTAIATNSGLNYFLKNVMQDEPVLMHNMVRAKPPSSGDKPWHQDLTHFNVHPTSAVVTAWIALDDAPLESGCLHFIPGTHLKGPTKHVFTRDYQIPDYAVSRDNQVAAPVQKGSCVVFHSMLHHGSPPNGSPGRRLALQLTFKPSKALAISNEERIMAFAGIHGSNRHD